MTPAIIARRIRSIISRPLSAVITRDAANKGLANPYLVATKRGWQCRPRCPREAGIRLDADSNAQGIPSSMRIAIASDHAAIEMKATLAQWLGEQGHDVADLGPATTDSVDYPDFGYKLASHLAAGVADKGIALCGSGIGISIAVNRHPQARCALVSDGLAARLAREHNDANVIAMGARLIGMETAKDCVAIFLSTDFGGDRHQRRVDKLTNPQI